MNGLIELLRTDPEIQSLKKKCFELTGEWIPYHWDCFNGIDAYKEYMRKVIRDHESNDRE